jgi:hypothetical protein
MTAIEDITAERAKQIAHGYDAEHDDSHAAGELAIAAECLTHVAAYPNIRSADRCPLTWPFETGSWKTLDRRAQLVRAAAFLVAEIERMDREAAQ